MSLKLTRRQCLWALGGSLADAAGRDLVQEWQRMAAETDGTVGAAVLHLTTGQMVSLHGDQPFPLASVCKVPIAMNMLALVDEGKMAPDREVARSDNTAVETLFRIGGEGQAIAARMRNWMVEGIRVDRSERQCGLDRNGVERYPPPAEWSDATINALIAQTPLAARYQATRRYLADPRDTGTPEGTVRLLAKAFRGEALSKASTIRLIDILKATTTFPTRLKGLLPAGTVVAHKTGSTDTVNGLTAATNDSGVIYLPGDRGKLAISVYIKASTRDAASRDRIIARMSRAAFDFYQ